MRFFQRRYPWAHPRELFPCASLQWFFPCSLWQGIFPWDSSQAFLRALFHRAVIPRTLFQHRVPWAHQRLIFRTLLCGDFLRALFRLRFFRALFCRAFSVPFSRRLFRELFRGGSLFFVTFFPGVFCVGFSMKFFRYIFSDHSVHPLAWMISTDAFAVHCPCVSWQWLFQ